MKKIFVYIIALLPLTAFAQQPQTFTIKGKVGNLNPPAKAYLAYQVGANKVIDSAIVTNGNFLFKGELIYPASASLLLDHKGAGLLRADSASDILNFYIDKGDILITGADSVSKARIIGSKINDDNKRLMAQLQPIIDQAKQLNAEKKSATPAQLASAEFQNGLEERYKKLQTEQSAALKIFILSNPDSYLSLLALYSVGGPSPNPQELDSLYNSLSQDLKNTETAKVFKNDLDELRHTAIGAVAPDFTENDVNGKPVTLSSFRGKYVLVDFWASWCPPCRQESPNLVKAYNKFKDKNFTILGVSLDKTDGKANWLAAIKDDGLTWTQVSDLQFWNNKAAGLYDVTAIPANFLVDPSGKIIAKDLRGEALQNKLEEVLGKL